MTGGQAELARRLSLSDAVIVGLGAMLGAGVFAAPRPAAAAAGSWLLVGLGLAAVAVLALVNVRGVEKTARLARVLVALVLLVLAVTVAAALSGGTADGA